MGNRAVVLEPMTDEEFAAWIVPAVMNLAADHARAGRYTPEDALKAAKTEFFVLLPNSLATEGQYLYTVRDADADANAVRSAEAGTEADADRDGRERVGSLWIHLRRKAGRPEAYVQDIIIAEHLRGQGYGRATMHAAAQRGRELGAESMGLHVFGHNKPAQALYASLGFVATNITMTMPLAAAETAGE